MQPQVSPPHLDELVSPGHRIVLGMSLLVGHFVIGAIGDFAMVPDLLAPFVGPAFLVLAPLAIARWLGDDIRESFAIHPEPPSQLAWCAGIGLALVAPMVILGMLNSIFVETPQWFLEAVDDLSPDTPLEWTAHLLLVAVLVPFAEELVFRGILQPAAASALGSLRAVAAVGLIFALVHFQLWNLLPLAIIGMVLGLVRLTTGSIIGCAVAHGAYNLGVTLLGRLAASGGDEPNVRAFGLLMVGAFVGAWLCWVALGRLRPVVEPMPLDEGELR